MLRSLPRLAWGQFAAGPTRCWGNWIEFCRLPEDVEEARISRFWGGQDMQQQLQEAILQDWLMPLSLVTPQWMGDFMQLEVLVAMRACLDFGNILFFEVVGRLVRVAKEEGLVCGCIF